MTYADLFDVSLLQTSVKLHNEGVAQAAPAHKGGDLTSVVGESSVQDLAAKSSGATGALGVVAVGATGDVGTAAVSATSGPVDTLGKEKAPLLEEGQQTEASGTARAL